jgi:hypothetical protein
MSSCHWSNWVGAWLVRLFVQYHSGQTQASRDIAHLLVRNPFRLEATVRERTMEDLRGLIVELVAVDESGKDQLSTLEQPEVQKLKSIFAHQKLDLSETVIKVVLELHAFCGATNVVMDVVQSCTIMQLPGLGRLPTGFQYCLCHAWQLRCSFVTAPYSK